ncbi:unnamed protein product [Ixodes persulcatus]
MRTAERSLSCPTSSAIFVPSIKPQRLASVQLARAAKALRKAMSTCRRPGARKRRPAVLTSSVTGQELRGDDLNFPASGIQALHLLLCFDLASTHEEAHVKPGHRPR